VFLPFALLVFWLWQPETMEFHVVRLKRGQVNVPWLSARDILYCVMQIFDTRMICILIFCTSWCEN
jgi:hypothetical protein